MNHLMVKPNKCFEFTEYKIRAALLFFGIQASEIDSLGLQEIKQIVRKKYRQYVFKSHPDHGGRGYTYDRRSPENGGNKIYINQIKKKYERIKNLKYKPRTMSNCNSLLEITRGYKTTRDIDLGMNGHI